MLLNLIAAAVRRGGCWRGPRAGAMEKPPRNIRPEFHSDCAQRALSRHGKCSLKGQPCAPVRCRIVEIRDASGHNTSGDVGIVRAPCATVVETAYNNRLVKLPLPLRKYRGSWCSSAGKIALPHNVPSKLSAYDAPN